MAIFHVCFLLFPALSKRFVSLIKFKKKFRSSLLYMLLYFKGIPHQIKKYASFYEEINGVLYFVEWIYLIIRIRYTRKCFGQIITTVVNGIQCSYLYTDVIICFMDSIGWNCNEVTVEKNSKFLNLNCKYSLCKEKVQLICRLAHHKISSCVLLFHYMHICVSTQFKTMRYWY